MTSPPARVRALSLYRSLLRLHASRLPAELRSLGDKYVQSEFRAHKASTDAKVLAGFYGAWEDYQRQLLARSTEGGGLGRELPADVEMTEEQREQLGKLREEALKAGKSGKAGD
mmetsp:Transcript_20532/g.46591  ORF Transcript_20532/g.46591 Transcript_20532/m.46591 type:complete len:114 (-) Transcript_20532:91-432(-)